MSNKQKNSPQSNKGAKKLEQTLEHDFRAKKEHGFVILGGVTLPTTALRSRDPLQRLPPTLCIYDFFIPNKSN